MISLLGFLRENEQLQHLLKNLDRLPAICFKDPEWEVLHALFILLRYAVLELKLAFQSSGEVDFAEISLKSLHALGQIDEPSELLLKLDYQIQHLLVDEFQDTSINQFQLLEKLTSGWELGDGRSLFLVGDPMQSIYRFREAEVGLFIKTKNHGLGFIQPDFLQLTVNFRSQGGIIKWVNEAFPLVFPSQDDMFMGAVSYASSEAARDELPEPAMHLYPHLERHDKYEADQVLQIIQQAQLDDPDGTIAILVSGRSHLKEIVHLLGNEQISFNAVKIDSLAAKPVVKDLMALTLAILHLDDRIHWLAILRAPWCGLKLADLLVLGEHNQTTIMASMFDESNLSRLSSDGLKRVLRFRAVLHTALEKRGRKTLRDWIEGVWINLGGPAVVTANGADESAYIDAEEYFRLLEKLDQSGDLQDYFELEKQVTLLYAQSDPEVGKSLQIMTIHAAKGLEFDTVIIPGMGRSPGRDQSQLLYWLENTQGESSELLFAPINATGQNSSKGEKNKTAAFIKKLESDKRQYESGRLLYVAVTRAKKQLHLIGHVGINSKEEITPPPANSLLNSLWPVVKENYQQKFDSSALASINEKDEDNSENTQATRYCLPADWNCPIPESDIIDPSGLQEMPIQEDPIEFNWAGDISRHVGTVVHRILEHQALSNDAENVTLQYYQPIARQLLGAQGLSGGDLDQASERVLEAIENTMEDETGRWILSDQHQQAACELPLSIVEAGEIRHIIIDRTFIDADGVRWIIDYKTGSHSGGGLEEFLQQEQERYQGQLERYAQAMQKIEDRSIKMALYFPLLKELRVISIASNSI